MMCKSRNPNAVVRAGASEIDQLGQQISSKPSVPLHHLQALRIVVARPLTATPRITDTPCRPVRFNSPTAWD